MRTFGLLQYVSRKIRILHLDNLIEINQRSLQWISAALPDLEEISLKNCKTLSDTICAGIIAAAPNLIQIDVSGCKGVSNRTIAMISTTLRSSLRYLAISNIGKDLTTDSIIALAEQCSALGYLDFSFNSNIHSIITNQSDLSSTASKGQIAISNLNANYCSISAQSLASMAPQFTSLLSLSIAGAFINDAALEAVSICCRLLKSVDISNCLSLTDVGVEQLCNGAKHLQELRLSQYRRGDTKRPQELQQQYTDKVMRSLLITARRLIEVSLCNQPGILFTSKWLRKIFPTKRNNTIEQLDLRGCENLSSAHLSVILNGCTHLNDVILPDKFFQTEISKRKFWQETFSGMVYVQPYSEQNYKEQWEAYHEATKVVVSTKKLSLAESIAGEKRTEGPLYITNLNGFR